MRATFATTKQTTYVLNLRLHFTFYYKYWYRHLASGTNTSGQADNHSRKKWIGRCWIRSKLIFHEGWIVSRSFFCLPMMRTFNRRLRKARQASRDSKDLRTNEVKSPRNSTVFSVVFLFYKSLKTSQSVYDFLLSLYRLCRFFYYLY